MRFSQQRELSFWPIATKRAAASDECQMNGLFTARPDKPGYHVNGCSGHVLHPLNIAPVPPPCIPVKPRRLRTKHVPAERIGCAQRKTASDPQQPLAQAPDVIRR
jgi:hypothetical protein